MEFLIKPPISWNEKTSQNEFNIYDQIFCEYKDSDIVFKIIKENLEVLELSKIDCINFSTNLSIEIMNNIVQKKKNEQLKIFGILGASEESVIFMLSSLFLGAHHCICFEDLSEEAICQRIKLFKPDIVLSRKKLESKLSSIKRKIKMPLLNFRCINLKSIKNDYFETKEIRSISYRNNSSLFTLFTSGSTGLPKAIVHGGKDFLDYGKHTTEHFFGIKKGSTMFSAVDAGWINGHTYSFYGPLLLGAVSIINENPLLITMPKLLAEYIEKLKPDCFYTSVTLFRLIKSLTPSDKSIHNFFKDDSNFRINRIGSCGEPLAHAVGEWAVKFFNPIRKTIVNTYFQTETGGIIVAPRDEDTPPNDYSCVGKPDQEMKIVLASQIKDINELKIEKLKPNELLICNKWKGIFQKVISDKQEKYFTSSGEFRLHDVGYFDHNGFLFIGGRSDDVINVSGHRISSSEIENICMSVDQIVEVCAVALPDDISGSKVILFFTSKFFEKELIKNIKSDLNQVIYNNLTQYHVPKEIHYFKTFPKTKSGKIMRRIMRNLAQNFFDEKKDYSTIGNKEEFFLSKDNFFKENFNNKR